MKIFFDAWYPGRWEKLVQGRDDNEVGLRGRYVRSNCVLGRRS